MGPDDRRRFIDRIRCHPITTAVAWLIIGRLAALTIVSGLFYVLCDEFYLPRRIREFGRFHQIDSWLVAKASALSVRTSSWLAAVVAGVLIARTRWRHWILASVCFVLGCEVLPHMEFEITRRLAGGVSWPNPQWMLLTFVEYWCLDWLIVVVTILLMRRQAAIPPTHCQNCRYDLTGNESGICPECGTPRSTRAALTPPARG